MLKVGLLVGREWSFPPAFMEEVQRRDEGVVAEYVKLGGTRMDEAVPYAVIIDRISHEVPYYRSFLKHALLQGTMVVNNPFMWTADDKFFGASMITKLGIQSPKTVALPNKEYIPGIVHDESLRNLVYPMDWQGLADYIGMPCILKDAHGGGWKDVYVCQSLDELIQHYNGSGRLTMVVQEFIQWDKFVRCICLGQEEVQPIHYDPKERRYIVEENYLDPQLRQRVIDESLRICRALDYDMNSIEWAIRDGVPYAIDFMNPAPDMDVNSLTPHYFEWVVKGMASMAIKLAKQPRLPRVQFHSDAPEPPSTRVVAKASSGASGSVKKATATATTPKSSGGAAKSTPKTPSSSSARTKTGPATQKSKPGAEATSGSARKSDAAGTEATS